jgi:Na+/H+ antiporter NhaD/arsenite permease-like protein
VDYSLLLTFAGFFVFIGNMGRVPAFRIFLEGFVAGRETLTAVLASQVLSNVPATLLLADFTDDLPALIVGANLGGLGTLIASMASLISYKLFARREPAEKGRYLLTFTAANVAFLLVLLCCRGL